MIANEAARSIDDTHSELSSALITIVIALSEPPAGSSSILSILAEDASRVADAAVPLAKWRGQPCLSRRQTDRSDGPHLNSKSNAPAKRGDELLSQPDVGLGRRIITQSRRVSQNALLATHSATTGQRRLKKHDWECC